MFAIIEAFTVDSRNGGGATSQQFPRDEDFVTFLAAALSNRTARSQ
jgi:hypothetical protein